MVCYKLIIQIKESLKQMLAKYLSLCPVLEISQASVKHVIYAEGT